MVLGGVNGRTDLVVLISGEEQMAKGQRLGQRKALDRTGYIHGRSMDGMWLT